MYAGSFENVLHSHDDPIFLLSPVYTRERENNGGPKRHRL